MKNYSLLKCEKLLYCSDDKVFSQYFGNMTRTHEIGNFSGVLLKIWEEMYDYNFTID